MKILTASLAAVVLATSFVAARAEERDVAAAPVAVYLQSIGRAAAAAAPVIESRQAAPIVSGSALSERDRIMIEHTSGESH
ncbi:hypothetical protein EYW49_00690 [Siculibacillus lacustris]|uniref:DUF4148 domain-containing protein n=1 Tax=Siculibacillus lacustris TaxID=1549641 RepID=A0A4V2KUG4_9HYPH|nr:hypothetical protein [Siculibacillus lacustris]TBW41275.1 hypothetical protein EYW49_00690 [Siculibacillus lacustris]